MSHYDKYIKYKTKYLNLKKPNSYLNLTNNNKRINNKSEKYTKENTTDLIKNNTFVKISFVPRIYPFNVNDEFSLDPETIIKPIPANIDNYKILRKVIGSERWKNFLKYGLEDLTPNTMADYGPLMYYLTDITTILDMGNDTFVIVIIGVINKYSGQEIYEKYLKSDALNKLWNEKIIDFTKKRFEELVYDGFSKDTDEGELIVPELGYLKLSKIQFEYHYLVS